MFRLHKNRQAKSGEKFDFKLSNFKAVQVPKGWDKLFVSVVSEQNGKTIIRSSKASVRNGSCQWTECVSESVWVSQDEISKEFEDCNFKLVVAMGSGRSNILGEAVVNITKYADSKSSAVSLPLNKCDYGTMLMVKIQCLTPISKVRSGDLKQTNSRKEDLKKDGHDSDSFSDRTDSQLSRSIGSSSGVDLYSSLHSGEASSKEASFSASYSQLSNASSEVYESLENDAAKNNYGDIQRQDSASSHCSSPNSVITGSAEATTVAELRAEARMWERNAHKLMAELDQLKKELSDQSHNQESLNIALSAATAECDDLRKELEQMKQSTGKSTQRQTTIEDLPYQDGEPRILNELQDELKFLKESNADLSQQLNRSQESNVELVAVLQELESIAENQKLEIEELLAQHREDNDNENIVRENKKLMLQLEHVKESEKNLQLKVELLERNLEETKLDLQKCKVSNRRFPQDTDREFGSKLHSEQDMGSLHSVDTNLVKEIEMLKEKVQELEKDCNELTEENMELLYKLKQANDDSKGEVADFDSTDGDHLSNSFVNFGFDTIKNKHSKQNIEGKLEESPNLIEKNDSHFNKKLESMIFELEVQVEELSRELTEKKLEIGKLESSMLSKDDEIKILGDLHNKLQVKYSDLQKEKNDLRNEVKELSNSVDLHVSANEILESKSLELEREKLELELHISQMEQERMQLSERISALESQLKYVTDEKENDAQNQCAEAQDQCEYLQREKRKLEAAAEHLVEERNLLQKSNGELQKKNSELHESYFRLESKLKESLQRYAQYFRRVDDFEEYLSLGLEDFASKERFLSSELDSLVEENIKYKEASAMFESMYNEVCLEKNDLNIKQMESDEKLTALVSELSLSKQNQEILISDHEKLLKQVENYRSLEVKLENSVNDLEDFSSRNNLEATKKDKEKAEATFDLISKECEDLRTENNSLLEKIIVLQITLAELENSKLLGTESDAVEYQQKLKILEEEKDEWLKRSQSLEAELKLLKEEKQNQRESSSVKVHGFSKTNGKNMPSKDTKLPKNHSGKKKPALKSSQSHEQVKDPKDPNSNQSQSQILDDSGYDEDSHVPEAEFFSRIQLLEKELAEALEAKENYKVQLSRLVSDNQKSKERSLTSTVEGDGVAKERYESINLALEVELNEIRERYLHVSLKYAEVEQEREELVMKLREAAAPKNGRRWFS